MLVFRSAQSSIGYVFLIHAPKLQMYEQYIKASPRSVRTLETWRKKDPDFNKLVTLFQVIFSRLLNCFRPISTLCRIPATLKSFTCFMLIAARCDA